MNTKEQAGIYLVKTVSAFRQQLGWELLRRGLASLDDVERKRALEAVLQHVLDNSGIGRTWKVVIKRASSESASTDAELLLAWTEQFKRSLSDPSLEESTRGLAVLIADEVLRKAVLTAHDAVGRFEFVLEELHLSPKPANRILVQHVIASLRVGDESYEWASMEAYLKQQLEHLRQVPGHKFTEELFWDRVGKIKGFMGERLAQAHPQWRETVRRAEQVGREIASNMPNPLNWEVRIVYEDIWMSVTKGDAVDKLGHDGVVVLVQKVPDPNKSPRAYLLATMQSKGGARASQAAPKQSLLRDPAREALGKIALGKEQTLYALVGLPQRSPLRFMAATDPTTVELYRQIGMREANIGWLPYSGEDMTKVAIEAVNSLVRTAQVK